MAGERRSEVLKASMSDVRPFAHLLRAICFSSSKQRATMTINVSGIMVLVEEAHTLLGAAWISQELFDEFNYASEVIHQSEEESDASTVLSFQLNTFLECLNIFGTASGNNLSGLHGARHPWRKDDESDGNGQDDLQLRRNVLRVGDRANSEGKGTGMRLTYPGEGHPLVLLLAESSNGPTTVCELVTYEPEPQLEMPLDGENIVLKCILKSTWLRDAFLEADATCDKITFIGNPSSPTSINQRSTLRPLLRIQTTGTFGSAEMDYPNDREVLETFECSSTVSFSYRFSHMSRVLRALQGSSKTSLRIDAEGTLSLQFLSSSASPRTGTQVDSIVDFRCLSIDET